MVLKTIQARAKLLYKYLFDTALQRSLVRPVLEFETIYGYRNRVGIRLSYGPARLHRLAELIP